MAKHHINPTTGNPGECSAQDGNCPFGADAPHFSTAEDARVAYEISQQGSWPSRGQDSKVVESLQWEDAASLERREPTLNRPDTDFGFNWTVEGQLSQSRVSLAKWHDEQTGTLYAHNASQSTAAIIAHDISVTDVDKVWHAMLKEGPMTVDKLHQRLKETY